MADTNANASIQPLLEAGAALGSAKVAIGERALQYAVYPAGWTIQPLEVEALQDRPYRRRGGIMLRRPADFAFYVQLYSEPGTIIVREDDEIVAYLNHHEPGEDGEPGWSDNNATWSPEWTDEWKLWKAHLNAWLTQDTFATLIEDRMSEIAKPDASQLLAAARDLRIQTNVLFETKVDLQNGNVHLRYTEESSHQKGTFELPEKITLVMAPFYPAGPVPIEARLRWRVSEKAVHFKLDVGTQLARIVRDAFDEAAAIIEEGAKLPVWRGHYTPPGIWPKPTHEKAVHFKLDVGTVRLSGIDD